MTERRALRAVGGLGLLSFALVAVRAAGTGALAGPPTSSGRAFLDWVDERGPATVAMSLVRLATEGVLWYLVAVAAVVVVAGVTRSAVAVRFADVVAAPVPDRVIRVALGISLATAVQPTPLSGGHLAAGPRATGTATMVMLDGDDATGAVPTMERLPTDGGEVATGGPVETGTRDGDTARATPWPDRHRPDGDAAASSDPPSPAPAPSPSPSPSPSTWTVAEGESFWVIADELTSDRLGRPATDAEIVPCWETLIDTNRHRLVDPDNPDLILPGQVMELPAQLADAARGEAAESS